MQTVEILLREAFNAQIGGVEPVQDERDLSQMMNNHRAGDKVKITVYRGKKKIDVDVTLGEAREQV